MNNALGLFAPKIAIGLLGTTLLLSDLGAAHPALYSPWAAAKIDNPQGLDYLRDTKDERLIWVKPPRMGTIGAGEGGVSHHPNHDLCPNLAQSLQDLSANTDLFTHSLTEIKGYIADSLNARRAQKQVLDGIDQTLEAAGNPSEGAEILAAVNGRNRNQLALVDVTHRVDACQTACKDLYWQKFNLETAIEEHQKQVTRLKSTYPKLSGDLIRLADQLWQYKRDEYQLNRSRRNSQGHLFRAERRLFKSYAQTAAQPAGSRWISYRLRWSEAIAMLAERNPNFSFKPIPIRSLRLRARHLPAKIDDFYLSSLPAVVGFEGVSDVLKNFGDVDVHGKFSVDAIDRLQGKFTFSLNGACPLVDEDFSKVLGARVAMGSQGQPLFAATLTYAYLVQLPKAVPAKFDPVAIYEVLRKSHKDGSFVSQAAAQQLLDQGAIDDAIQLPADLAKPLAITLKREVLNRVLEAMMTVSGDVSSASTNKATDSQIFSHDSRKYSTKVAGWDFLKGKARKGVEADLARRHSGWQQLTFGESDLMALTDIALFKGVSDE